MKTYVYNLADFQLIDCLDTCSNPRGLVALNTADHIAILATLFLDKGYVRIRDFNKEQQGEVTMPVHDGMIGCMALNRDGTLLATAVEKGTIVRLWITGSHQPYMNLRRDMNADSTEIQDLSFSRSNNFLALCGEMPEIFVYNIGRTAAS